MVIGKHEGEAPADALISTVRELISQYDAYGTIARSPIDALAREDIPDTSLAFPGKVLADDSSGRLFIADSGHNRVLVTDFAGQLLLKIGSGERGWEDGGFSNARFDQPQGMVLDHSALYIADTGNGSVRVADLETGEVRTIAGTGHQGAGMPEPGPARETELRSPWDLALHEEFLYVAMAGTHQIWRLNILRDEMEPYAGDGVEAIRDGDRTRAWLAQPSGLSIEDGRLYFTDSETSAIRFVELPPGDQVQTLVGTGLFDFGDVDGIGERARLQHPIGVTAHKGIIYVADSYNHKIKRLYPNERRVEGWLGSGEAGSEDGECADAFFDEPAGLSAAGDRLYIADTNNHAVRVADLSSGNVLTLDVRLD
jgi:DNA-binding beta-propeller fold protein YncE